MYKDFNNSKGFSVLEVIVSLALLGIGMLGVIQLFPAGLESSIRSESSTRAAILAQQIMESLKADSHDFPFIPGELDTFLGIPGNGFDDDRIISSISLSTSNLDCNGNGKMDMDYDGNFRDNLNNSTGESGSDGFPDLSIHVGSFYNNCSRQGFIEGDGNGDGDPYYDPELGVDDYPGICGLNSQNPSSDCMLAYNFQGGFSYPLEPGDGIDNNGNSGETNGPTLLVRRYAYPQGLIEVNNRAIADGVDNNDDGVVDDGIDEDFFDPASPGEDCKMATYPFTPRSFGPLIIAPSTNEEGLFDHPNERFAWQISVGRISDGSGDGRDNDGDGLIDEDPRDGIDNDQDGRIDEDPYPMPLPGIRKVVVRITWGGDKEDNDGDNRIDEELDDGIDNDLDGLVDEDIYKSFYQLTGFIKLKSTTQGS